MKAKILDKSEEHLWDDFIKTHPLSTIHQNSAWGHFQEKIPSREKYWIIVLEDSTNSSKIIGGTLLIRHALPKGYCWLYAARGPLIDYDSKKSQEQINELLTAIKPIANKEKAIFMRIDPPLQTLPTLPHFHTTHSGFQPEHTLIIDLTKSEKDILSQMKQKGRYNIRLAEKKGVEILEATPKDKENLNKHIDSFYEILQQTTTRDGFYSHPKEFYKTMLKTLVPTKNATLYLAKYNEKIIAGIIVTFYKDTATYYYGASSNEYRNVMAPYLLQWHAIKEAKAKNYKHYDFLGIAPSNAKNHPWKGVTEFKKKFGGKEVSYQPAQEHPFKKLLYLIYRIYKKINKH